MEIGTNQADSNGWTYGGPAATSRCRSKYVRSAAEAKSTINPTATIITHRGMARLASARARLRYTSRLEDAAFSRGGITMALARGGGGDAADWWCRCEWRRGV